MTWLDLDRFFWPQVQAVQSGWTKITHLAVNEVLIGTQRYRNSKFLFPQCLQSLEVFVAAHQPIMQHNETTLLAIGDEGCSLVPQHSWAQPSLSALHELEEPWMDTSSGRLCRPSPWVVGH